MRTKRRRAVHYVAAGHGLAFECWRQEQRAYSDEYKKLSDQKMKSTGGYISREEYRNMKNKPAARSTNLNAVTCQSCWADIFRMAHERSVDVG